MAIGNLPPGTVAVTTALGRAFSSFAPPLRGCLVAAPAVAAAIPVGVVPSPIAITIAAFAAAVALASGAVGVARLTRMVAPSLASLSFIAPSGA